MLIFDNSFIMIRPDGSQIIDGIDSLIKNDGFEIQYVFHIPVWDDVYLSLHQRELSDADNLVSDNVRLNVWICKKIFGNNALLLLLSHPKSSSLEDLVNRTFDLKFKIRDTFQNTRDGKFVISINASLIDIELSHLKRNGNLLVVGDDQEWIFSEKMIKKGNYVPAYFNYVHTPEKGLQEITEEYGILYKKKVLSLDNKLTNSEYENCKIMHSCYRNKGV